MEPETSPLSLRATVPFWFRLGCISFGGPAGQIAMMHDELVVRRAWISERRFLHALNYCMVLPGPEAQQLATYIGWLQHGVAGGIVAGGLFILPSFCLLVALSWLYVTVGQVPWVAAILAGVQPIVLALVFAAAWRIGGKSLRSLTLISLAIGSFIATIYFHVPFPLVVLGAAALGWFLSKVVPTQFQNMPAHRATAQVEPSRRARIADDDPTPPHALFDAKRWWTLAICGSILWCGPLFVLVSNGWHEASSSTSLLGDMSLFFSAAALVTFGGAYAVLPYVAERAVNAYGWLEPHQMLDGLALGESTPGPLIIIVTFVGFVGGYQTDGGGWWGGLAGAVVATYFTFLPSFLFILLGGPFVERMRGAIRFDACLSAVMAAVVGMIVYLGLFLMQAILLRYDTVEGPNPLGFGQLRIENLGITLDWLASVLAVMAWMALTRLKTPLMWLFGIGMIVGLLRFSIDSL